MKNCSKCGLLNPDSAQLCDCGLSFETGLVQDSPLGQREQNLTTALRLVCGVFGGISALLGWFGLVLGAIAATVAYAMYQRQMPKAAGDGIAAYGVGVAIVVGIQLALYLVVMAGVVASKA